MPALFVLYVVVEIAALVVAGHFLGAGWTVLLLLAGTMIGVVLMKSQWRRVADGFRSASRGTADPGAAVADGALVASGSALMVVPGLVTSVLGLLLLVPVTRRVLRPVAVAVAGRRAAAMVGGAHVYTRVRRGGDVIDGEVVDEVYDPDLRADNGRVLDGEVVDGEIVDDGSRGTFDTRRGRGRP
ncbi:FxsA family protein [Rhodococcus sp. HNM0569]|uniref:FxsA family protein n=1 Tax=Rhodococcus sp. HNM0569 TaxID=2716340 RepID=UPI00146AF586|nr:FxsA family protein [Rhodococcus sp. HNM0569]NLU84926.1 FxsA family protein [Rhodococcus sp. HNM0569]